MTETLQLRGTLLGHNGWVTQIATNPKDPDTILSSSRGKYKSKFYMTRIKLESVIKIQEFPHHPLLE